MKILITENQFKTLVEELVSAKDMFNDPKARIFVDWLNDIYKNTKIEFGVGSIYVEDYGGEFEEYSIYPVDEDGYRGPKESYLILTNGEMKGGFLENVPHGGMYKWDDYNIIQI
ncbi:hypothetical protein COB55_03430 [Candidatus Wolfebacteria bacterium]|nr:MAG: hypothetical protein COB55_03430 [Candidatus Wolfebacteria bacterium]